MGAANSKNVRMHVKPRNASQALPREVADRDVRWRLAPPWLVRHAGASACSHCCRSLPLASRPLEFPRRCMPGEAEECCIRFLATSEELRSEGEFRDLEVAIWCSAACARAQAPEANGTAPALAVLELQEALDEVYEPWRTWLRHSAAALAATAPARRGGPPHPRRSARSGPWDPQIVVKTWESGGLRARAGLERRAEERRRAVAQLLLQHLGRGLRDRQPPKEWRSQVGAAPSPAGRGASRCSLGLDTSPAALEQAIRRRKVSVGLAPAVAVALGDGAF